MKLAKLLILNLVLFIGLIFGTILFEFLFLGWGASANSPDFSVDLPLVCQLIILGFLSIRAKMKNNDYKLIIVFSFLLGFYLILKFALLVI